MGVLPGAIMNIDAAVGCQQPVQRFGYAGGRCARTKPDGKIVELICHAKVRRQLRTLHPDNAEALIVGDDLPRSERKNEFGRESDAANREDAFVSADRHCQPTAGTQTVGRRKALVDHDLPGMFGRGGLPLSQREGVDLRIAIVRQRYQPASDRFVEAINRNCPMANDSDGNRRHSRDPADSLGKRQGRGRNRDEQVGKSITPVVILACGVERTAGAERHAHCSGSAGEDKDDAQCLPPESPKIADQLAIEDVPWACYHDSPCGCARAALLSIRMTTPSAR